MSENSLVAGLKATMGYTEVQNTCSTCITHEEVDMGEHTCKLNPAVQFRVSPDGTCNFWGSKAAPTAHKNRK